MSDLKVGVVGCGLISQLRHIPAYKKLKGVQLQAVCDLNEDLARETAEKFKVPNFYTKTSKMFADEDLDIVDICVPPQIHAPIAVEAMESGSHVIMEKPMALNASDCEEMIRIAEEKDLKLSVVHNDLFHPPFIKAKEMVHKGEIGEFRGMRIFLSTPKHDMIDLKDHWYHKLPGGVIGETGPHISYMSLEFLENIKNVDVFAKSFLNYDWAPHDDFRIEIEAENGFSSVALTYTTNYWAATIDIIGSKAMLHIDLDAMQLVKHKLGELSYMPVAKQSLGHVGQRIGSTLSTTINVLSGRQKIGTEIVVEKFVESILNGDPLPVAAQEGLEATKLMEDIVGTYKKKYGLE
ncbi:Gfo/Idh/MocA family oxidoreductase [Methanobacterium sp.]|uniref:Gfo/Idh/MocA family protein n=1 Tax=Methanobacterium sp. TaxID=2164 RepID=UPI0025FE1D48|nr:Gfo/Idh/MocA family oxidoreductase [Methanobacterium sp.]MBI5459246.1 Gfo/Idh/MocA family oxidoreductase [Methanobacterium sp.]